MLLPAIAVLALYWTIFECCFGKWPLIALALDIFVLAVGALIVGALS